MISNERPSPFNRPRRPSGSCKDAPQPLRPDEKILRTEKLQKERKFYSFQLKENPRGRFIRIIEETDGRRNGALIIQEQGFDVFLQIFGEMLKASAEMPEGTAKQPSQNA